MRLRNLLLVGLLGVAVAVLPAMASSETTPTVEAVVTGHGGPYGYETFAWSPTQATISAGGSVTFSTGSTMAEHGVVWTSAIKPTCSSSVPVGESTEPKKHWSGSCTFAQAGEYKFHCSVHPTEMVGTIIVTAAGTTTTMTTSSQTTTTTSSTTTTPSTPPPSHPSTTNAKKLAKALKACRKKPKGKKRAACIKRARRRFGRR